MAGNPIAIWGITDGSAGMVAQVRALALALGVEPVMKTCRLRAPFGWIPNAVYVNTFPLLLWLLFKFGLRRGGDDLSAPLPRIIISCGRRAAAVAMALSRFGVWGKTEEGDTTIAPPFFVHIQDPRCDIAAFDLVVAMAHDRIARKSHHNVVVTHYALHSIRSRFLNEAAQRWDTQFAAYPVPRVALLFGGSTNRYTLTSSHMQEVVERLRRWHASFAGSLLITPSRRTGAENAALLKQAFAGDGRVYCYDGSGDNPYLALLGLADYLIVTDDSVNMMTEAAATGKPLYLLRLPGHRNTKPSRFADKLITDGIARVLPDTGVLERWEYRIPDEAEMIARIIKKRANEGAKPPLFTQ